MIEAHQLRAMLDYSPATGVFTWRTDCKYGSHKIGDVAGSPAGRGYQRIVICQKAYAAHRLAWLHVYGEWPLKHIDHKNRNGSDNRIQNLREASPLQNQANKAGKINSRSGLKGVVPTESGRWAARIRIAGRMTGIGTFDSPTEASAAYLRVAREIHGEFAST